MNSLSSKLKAFRSSGLGSKLIPDLYDLIEEMLISQLENERDQYQINDAAMKYVKDFCDGMEPIERDFGYLLQSANSTIKRQALVRTMNVILAYDSISYAKLLTICYNENDMVALKEIMNSNIFALTLRDIHWNSEDYFDNDDDKEESIRIYKEVFTYVK